MGGAGACQWPALQAVAAHLFSVQGRHDEALRLQLQLRSPAVFDYIARHALVGSLTPLAAGAPGLAVGGGRQGGRGASCVRGGRAAAVGRLNVYPSCSIR